MRPLRADEVELRVGSIGEKGVTLLLYKNARVDMNMLDEAFGPYGWQKDNKEIKGNVYCGIGVLCNNLDEWIWKWACGTESYTEKEKGEDSDSFKRAGFLWGIGRELYTAPLIFIKIPTIMSNGRYVLADNKSLYGMRVQTLETFELDSKRVISKIVIVQKDKKIYEWEIGK